MKKTKGDNLEIAEILDEYTPHGRSRMSGVPLTERRILAALLSAPEPVKLKDLAAAAHARESGIRHELTRLSHRRGYCRKVGRGLWTYTDPWLAMWYRARRAKPGALETEKITAGVADLERILADAPAMLQKIRLNRRNGRYDVFAAAEPEPVNESAMIDGRNDNRGSGLTKIVEFAGEASIALQGLQNAVTLVEYEAIRTESTPSAAALSEALEKAAGVVGELRNKAADALDQEDRERPTA